MQTAICPSRWPIGSNTRALNTAKARRPLRACRVAVVDTVISHRPSQYNDTVTVIEVPRDAEGDYESFAGARILLLDRTGHLHSVYRRDHVLTGRLWDHLATLPSLVPPGPIAMLGLGAGTTPRIMAAHYRCGPPNHDDGNTFTVHGWELDPEVVYAGRRFLGMELLEQRGQLVVHTGDALADEATVPGGFSGIVVDLFAGGRLLPQLTKRATWEALRSRLTPGGASRLLVNLGQSPPTVPGVGRWADEAYTTLRAYEAMEAAFEGEVSLLTVDSNTLALTGPLPTAAEWPGLLPAGLQQLGAAGGWARDVYPLQTLKVELSLW